MLPLTTAQINALDTTYDMGRVWETATESEKAIAVRTVEGAWRAFSWNTSPFDNASIATALNYVLSLAARHVVENQGSQGVTNRQIDRLLAPHLVTKRFAPFSARESTANGSGTLTGSQIVALIDTALGTPLWQTGGTGTPLTGEQIVQLIDVAIGDMDWQGQPDAITGSDVVALVDAALGNTDWQTRRTQLTGSAIVGLIDTALGSANWQSGSDAVGIEISAVKPFARVGDDTPPLAVDIGVDPEDGYIANTTYELGQRIEGGVRKPQWVARIPASGGFFISFTVRPTPAQIAVGGWAAGGGHVLVVPTDGPEEIWVRYTATSNLVKVATFADSIIRQESGELPAAEDNQHRLAISGNRLLIANLVQSIAGHGRTVTFQNLPSGGVTIGGTLRAQHYAGIHSSLPDANNYVFEAFLWLTNAQAWYLNQSDGQGGHRWIIYSGPSHFIHGDYGSDTQAAPHIHNVGEFYVRNSNPEKVRIANAINPAVEGSETWVWQPIGVVQQDIDDTIAVHNAASDAHADIRLLPASVVATHNTASDAHADIRQLISTLQASGGLSISAYSSTATYSRGSSNSIVTHANALYVYISGTERSANHDPGQQPGYWFQLSEGVAYAVVTSGARRFAARTLVVDGNTDAIYLCTTTQTTPRDLAYIAAQASSIGGTFIQVGFTEIPRDKLPPVREWTFNSDYKKGEIVDTTGGGHVHFIALMDNSSPSLNPKQPGTPDGAGTWDQLYTVDNPPPVGGGAKTWEPVGEWSAPVTANGTDMTYLANTKFAEDELDSAFVNQAGQDIGWLLRWWDGGSVHQTPVFHNIGQGYTQYLMVQDNNVQAWQFDEVNDKIRLRAGVLITGSSINDQVTASKKIQLWVLA